MKTLIPYITALLLLVALMHQCGKNSENVKQYEANIDALTDTVKHFKNALNTQTAGIKTLQFNRKQLQEVIVAKDAELALLTKEFAKLNSVTKFKSKIVFEPIAIAHNKPVLPVSVQDTVGEFKRMGAVFNKWYSLNYGISNDSLVIHPFTAYTETTVVTGIKKKWFLGRETITTEITNSNPYITVTEVKAAQVVLPQPVYKKWYVWLGVGIAGGLLIK